MGVRLPMRFKFRESKSKYLLKQVLCRSLPPNFVHQPKRGFSVPIGPWLRGPLNSWAIERFNDRSMADRVPLDMNLVRGLFALQSSGRRDSYPILWAVLMLLCFVSEYADLGPGPALQESVGERRRRTAAV